MTATVIRGEGLATGIARDRKGRYEFAGMGLQRGGH